MDPLEKPATAITITEGPTPDICPRCLVQHRCSSDVCVACQRKAQPSDGELLAAVAAIYLPGETVESIRRDAAMWLWVKDRFSRACPVTK